MQEEKGGGGRLRLRASDWTEEEERCWRVVGKMGKREE